MKTEKLLKLGKEYVRLHEFEQKAKEARKAWMEKWNAVMKEGFFSSAEWSTEGVILNIALAEYMAAYPDAIPKLVESEWDGKQKAWMKYPAQFIGDVRPGFHLWVQSSTRSVEKATAQVAEVAA